MLLVGVQVKNVINVNWKRQKLSGFLSGKKTDDNVSKQIGIVCSLPEATAATFAEAVQPFIANNLSDLTYITPGDGRTFTFFAEQSTIATLRATLGVVGDDVLQENDVLTITTRLQSLFVRSIEVTKADHNLSKSSQHAVTNLYVQKAVNVDEGLADNIAKAQQMMAVMGTNKKGDVKEDSDPDVEDDEWDD